VDPFNLKASLRALAASKRQEPVSAPEEEKNPVRKLGSALQADIIKEAPPGLLQSAGNLGLSGLAVIGNALDLPASMVRDVATWLPGGPKPANPFDQLLSPFSADNRTTGRDLTRGYGLAGKEDTWANFIPAMALEIGLDPLTYATFGASAALTKGGQAAAKAGMIDRAAKIATAKLKRPVGTREARHLVTPRMILDDLPPVERAATEQKLRSFGMEDADLDKQLGGLLRINKPFSNKPITWNKKPVTFGGLTDESGVVGAGKLRLPGSRGPMPPAGGPAIPPSGPTPPPAGPTPGPTSPVPPVGGPTPPPAGPAPSPSLAPNQGSPTGSPPPKQKKPVVVTPTDVALTRPVTQSPAPVEQVKAPQQIAGQDLVNNEKRQKDSSDAINILQDRSNVSPDGMQSWIRKVQDNDALKIPANGYGGADILLKSNAIDIPGYENVVDGLADAYLDAHRQRGSELTPDLSKEVDYVADGLGKARMKFGDNSVVISIDRSDAPVTRSRRGNENFLKAIKEDLAVSYDDKLPSNVVLISKGNDYDDALGKVFSADEYTVSPFNQQGIPPGFKGFLVQPKQIAKETKVPVVSPKVAAESTAPVVADTKAPSVDDTTSQTPSVNPFTPTANIQQTLPGLSMPDVVKQARAKNAKAKQAAETIPATVTQPPIDPNTGKVLDQVAAVDPIKEAEDLLKSKTRNLQRKAAKDPYRDTPTADIVDGLLSKLPKEATRSMILVADKNFDDVRSILNDINTRTPGAIPEVTNSVLAKELEMIQVLKNKFPNSSNAKIKDLLDKAEEQARAARVLTKDETLELMKRREVFLASLKEKPLSVVSRLKKKKASSEEWKSLFLGNLSKDEIDDFELLKLLDSKTSLTKDEVFDYINDIDSLGRKYEDIITSSLKSIPELKEVDEAFAKEFKINKMTAEEGYDLLHQTILEKYGRSSETALDALEDLNRASRKASQPNFGFTKKKKSSDDNQLYSVLDKFEKQYNSSAASSVPSGVTVDLKTLKELPEEARLVVGQMLGRVGERFTEGIQLRYGAKAPNESALAKIDLDQGIIDIFDNSIKNKRVTEDTVHELWHHLSRFFTDAELASVNDEYVNAIGKYQVDNPGASLPYHLSSIDEYVGKKMSDLTIKHLGRPKPEGLLQTAWGKMLEVFEYLWDTLRRSIGYNDTSLIMKDFLSGKRDPRVMINKTLGKRLGDIGLGDIDLKGGTLYSMSDEGINAGFKMKSLKLVNEFKQDKASSEQWRALFLKNLTKDEIDDLGLLRLLDDNPKLTKQQIIDHINENTPKLKIEMYTMDDVVKDPIKYPLRRFLDSEPMSLDLKYMDEYSVPGGIPNSNFHLKISVTDYLPQRKDLNEGVYYKTGHFPNDRNLIVHARGHDLVMNIPGKENAKIKVISEIQSDWHQIGKKEGYGTLEKSQLLRLEIEEINGELSIVKDIFSDEKFEIFSLIDQKIRSRLSSLESYARLRNDLNSTVKKPRLDKDLSVYGPELSEFLIKFEPRLRELISEIRNLSNEVEKKQKMIMTFDINPALDVPQANKSPFKGSYSMLAFKSVLKKAIDDGYDAVAIVDGADSARAVKGPVKELKESYDIKTRDIEKYVKKFDSKKIKANWNRSYLMPEGAVNRDNFLDDEQDVFEEMHKHYPGYTGDMSVFPITDKMRQEASSPTLYSRLPSNAPAPPASASLTSEQIAQQYSQATSAKIAKSLDRIQSKVGNSTVGRHMRALFDQTVLGTLTEQGQRIAPLAFKGYKGGVVKMRKEVAPNIPTWQGLSKLDENKIAKDELNPLKDYIAQYPDKVTAERMRMRDARVIRNQRYNDILRLAERPLIVKRQDGTGQWRRSYNPITTNDVQSNVRWLSPDQVDKVTRLLNWERRSNLGTFRRENTMGILESKSFNNRYVARVRSPMPGVTDLPYNPNYGELLDPSHPHVRARRPELEGYEDGTAVINDISTDPEFSGVIAKRGIREMPASAQIQQEIDDLAKRLWDKYGDRLDSTQGAIGFNSIADADLKTRVKKLAGYMANLDPRHAENAIPLFSVDLIGATMQRLEHSHRSVAHARIITKLAMDNLAHRSRFADRPGTALNLTLQEGGYYNETAVGRVLKQLRQKNKETVHSADKLIYDNLISPKVDDLRNQARNAILNGAVPPGYNLQQFGNEQVFLTDLVSPDAKLNLPAYRLGIVVPMNGRVPNKPKVRLVEVIDMGKNNPPQARIRNFNDPNNFQTSNYRSIMPEQIHLSELVVPADIADEIRRFIRPPTLGQEYRPLLRTYDKGLNIWKMLQTGALPFLSFHTRNFGSGQASNLFQGMQVDPRYAFNPSDSRTWLNPIKSFTKPIADAHALVTGGTVEGAATMPAFKGKGLSDSEATELLRQEIFALGLVGERQGLAAEQLQEAQESLRAQYPGVRGSESVNPLAGKFSPAEKGTTFGQRWLSPWLIKGGLADMDIFRPAQLGKDLAQYTEGLNRLAPYLAMKRQGLDPDTISKLVNEAQIDYTNLSNFERDFLRRVFPFYSYSRGIAPFVAKTLAQRPGGLMGQAITASAKAGQSEEASVTPDYIRETASIPLGRSADGTRSYITGFGMPYEDPAQLAVVARGDISGGLRELGSRLNPLAKALIEVMTQRSLYQASPMGGREIADLDPTIARIAANIKDLTTGSRTEQVQPLGGNPWLEYAIMNAGPGRLLNTVRTATDPRKYDVIPWKLLLNLGTGVRVADVSPGAQDAILRERIAKNMKDLGGRTFSTPYFPDYAKENWTPTQIEEANQIANTLKLLNRRANERKKVKQQEASQAQ
jgi:hypothetical protein